MTETPLVPILMYHRVGSVPKGATVPGHYVPTATFARQIRALHRFGYHPVSLAAAVDALANGAMLPPKPIVITFDDGYRHLRERAFPVLGATSTPTTVFLVASRLGGLNQWDIDKGDVEEPVLSIDEAVAAKKLGIEFGSHTLTHASLTDMTEDAAREEISRSKVDLEAGLGCPVPFFCYPYGAMNPAVRQMVIDAGYSAACATLKGTNAPGGDRFALRRINVRRDTWTSTLFYKIFRETRAARGTR